MVDTPPWLKEARIFIPGEGVTNKDCRSEICQHNENTDLIRYKDAVYLVHRSAQSQILGPNSSLWVYRSYDEGNTWQRVTQVRAPTDRDIRDPHFYIVGDQLFMKALTRLPVTSPRDSNVDTIAVGFRSSDGRSWDSLGPIGPRTWSFWRIVQQNGVLYNAAYEDGDKSVVLYSSTDGVAWTRGAVIYDVSADTPLETELVFVNQTTRMMALVRMDGNDQELLGDQGRLRTKVCFADPPYASFTCPSEFTGQRLDGPLAFFNNGRQFVVARKHLQGSGRKRTAVFEITGADTSTPQLKEWGELPSAGDTAYAGGVRMPDGRWLLSWYSSDLQRDENWGVAILGETDIWTAALDPRLLY
jgi:hypothetical protein